MHSAGLVPASWLLGHSEGAVPGFSSHVGEDSTDCAMGCCYQRVHAWTQAPLHDKYVLSSCSKQLGALQSSQSHRTLESVVPAQLYMAGFVCALLVHGNQSNGT